MSRISKQADRKKRNTSNITSTKAKDTSKGQARPLWSFHDSSGISIGLNPLLIETVADDVLL